MDETSIEAGAEASGAGPPDDDESLAAQRERVARLVATEDLLRELREAEQALEVERIAANVALDAARPRAPRGLEAEAAGPLADALAARSEAAARVARHLADAPGGGAEPDETARLLAGREALADWLEAPRRDPRNRIPRIAHGILVAGCAGAMVAAVAVHPVFLVVLIPLGLPLGYLAMSGQDTVWLRVGAERRFRATGLAAPPAWRTGEVEARLAALEAAADEAARRRDAARAASSAEDADSAPAALDEAGALADAEVALGDALRDLGLGPGAPDPTAERWLGLVFDARRAGRDLEAVQARRRRLGTQAERLRDRVFRYLSREGEAPPAGRADARALAAGLDRIERRGPAGGNAAGPKH